ncbi:creatininase family protein [Occultella gossypii]|uniref:Creatininase family protein n=1 Tax=Occultella gossypii TaxID=2800820 RepID=A0ABS7S956_9MICO|nr:creatininase family protein [Occultella gossypii]MBZ2196822.1 creatininase family protein [Occultella gossypii]
MAALIFDELTRAELRAVAPDATVVVPIGSTEQHGPHLPVCVDAAVITHLARAAATVASAAVPVVVTPTLPFGFAHHHLPFGGTISISMRVYVDVLVDIATSLAADGFRRILFVNGHGGNAVPADAAVDRLAYEQGLDVHVAATSYWTAAADVLAALDLDDAPKPGHAGSFETSLLLALRPELVRTDALPASEARLQPLASQDVPGGTVRHPGVWQASDGRTDDSRLASAAVGERVLAEIAEALSAFIVAFHKAGE